jgi:hypothetical protein
LRPPPYAPQPSPFLWRPFPAVVLVSQNERPCVEDASVFHPIQRWNAVSAVRAAPRTPSVLALPTWDSARTRPSARWGGGKARVLLAERGHGFAFLRAGCGLVRTTAVAAGANSARWLGRAEIAAELGALR